MSAVKSNEGGVEVLSNAGTSRGFAESLNSYTAASKRAGIKILKMEMTRSMVKSAGLSWIAPPIVTELMPGLKLRIIRRRRAILSII